ncbi:hypothetical protein HYH03_014707 [Edaphochlamys debaryana]|uniref:Myb-like domain-containing protein n=1 Tax=Edaphochlamys debaryana TaxID=47281 RepID=A0A835XQZ8_9CHLO|nr:hypothetical protein HYH03_014707 [Edaphochlamys debaryana]|eukprot:KAG2486651.1 hypothetical protein HYH03_014707 [Edaphochlamys debaryana]
MRKSSSIPLGPPRLPWKEAEEDLLALHHSELGPVWDDLASFFPGRAAAEIRSKWSCSVRLKAEYGLNLLQRYARLLAKQPTPADKATRAAVLKEAQRIQNAESSGGHSRRARAAAPPAQAADSAAATAAPPSRFRSQAQAAPQRHAQTQQQQPWELPQPQEQPSLNRPTQADSYRHQDQRTHHMQHNAQAQHAAHTQYAQHGGQHAQHTTGHSHQHSQEWDRSRSGPLDSAISQHPGYNEEDLHMEAQIQAQVQAQLRVQAETQAQAQDWHVVHDAQPFKNDPSNYGMDPSYAADHVRPHTGIEGAAVSGGGGGGGGGGAMSRDGGRASRSGAYPLGAVADGYLDPDGGVVYGVYGADDEEMSPAMMAAAAAAVDELDEAIAALLCCDLPAHAPGSQPPPNRPGAVAVTPPWRSGGAQPPGPGPAPSLPQRGWPLPHRHSYGDAGRNATEASWGLGQRGSESLRAPAWAGVEAGTGARAWSGSGAEQGGAGGSGPQWGRQDSGGAASPGELWQQHSLPQPPSLPYQRSWNGGQGQGQGRGAGQARSYSQSFSGCEARDPSSQHPSLELRRLSGLPYQPSPPTPTPRPSQHQHQHQQPPHPRSQYHSDSGGGCGGGGGGAYPQQQWLQEQLARQQHERQQDNAALLRRARQAAAAHAGQAVSVREALGDRSGAGGGGGGGTNSGGYSGGGFNGPAGLSAGGGFDPYICGPAAPADAAPLNFSSLSHGAPSGHSQPLQLDGGRFAPVDLASLTARTSGGAGAASAPHNHLLAPTPLEPLMPSEPMPRFLMASASVGGGGDLSGLKRSYSARRELGDEPDPHGMAAGGGGGGAGPDGGAWWLPSPGGAACNADAADPQYRSQPLPLPLQSGGSGSGSRQKRASVPLSRMLLGSCDGSDGGVRSQPPASEPSYYSGGPAAAQPASAAGAAAAADRQRRRRVHHMLADAAGGPDLSRNPSYSSHSEPLMFLQQRLESRSAGFVDAVRCDSAQYDVARQYDMSHAAAPRMLSLAEGEQLLGAPPAPEMQRPSQRPRQLYDSPSESYRQYGDDADAAMLSHLVVGEGMRGYRDGAMPPHVSTHTLTNANSGNASSVSQSSGGTPSGPSGPWPGPPALAPSRFGTQARVGAWADENQGGMSHGWQ